MPPILPDAISNLIYSCNSLQPFVRELQDWFGENSDVKNYHDNENEAQRSLILDFVDVDEYFPNVNINEIMNTAYFKSHDIIYCTDGTPCNVEIKSTNKKRCYLKHKKIPYEADLGYRIGDTGLDYGICVWEDSE